MLKRLERRREMIARKVTLKTESAWSGKVSNAIIGVKINHEDRTVELMQFKGAHMNLEQFVNLVFTDKEILRMTAEYLYNGRVKPFDIKEYQGDSGYTECKLKIEEAHKSGISYKNTVAVIKVSCFGKIDVNDLFRKPMYIGDLVELTKSATRLTRLEDIDFESFLDRKFGMSNKQRRNDRRECGIKEVKNKQPWWCREYTNPTSLYEIPSAKRWLGLDK